MHFGERWKFWRAQKKREGQARRLLIRSRKFSAFHRDLLPADRQQQLESANNQLEEALKTHTRVDDHSEHVKRILFPSLGGKITAPAWVEMFETVFVALVVAVSIRTFFVQPFQIPTNSMKPSYYGMTAKPASPTPLGAWDRFLQGATVHRLQSHNEGGKLLIQLNDRRQMLQQQSLLYYEIVTCRQLGIWPRKCRRYFFRVGNESVSIDLPLEFDFESVILETFFPNFPGKLMDLLSETSPVRREGIPYLSLCREVTATVPFLEFNLYRGDMLLVDRLTPHFFAPKRGESIVFLTHDVPALAGTDRYYIKRLVGVSGDQLAIFDDQLWVNGVSADFGAAMCANNRHEFAHSGYIPLGNLKQNVVSVPENTYFVLGDNSSNSYDSRFFGAIPRKAVCGRPLWVFYPLRRVP